MFLALLFVLVLSLVGALVESVSLQTAKNRKRAEVVLALESVFAEYDRQMLEQYDLFVRQSNSESTIPRRLEYYGAENMIHTISKRELLTDNRGNAFLEQAIRYAKDWLGVEEIPNETGYEFYSDTYGKEEELVYTDLQELLAQEEEELPEENNPLSTVKNLKNTNLITLVSSHPEEISTKSISIEQLPSERTLQEGNWGGEKDVGTIDKIFLVTYLLEHFHYFADVESSHTLQYEQEYLLGGYASDKENLEKVCEQILSVRMVANYAYLLTDTIKQTEAEAMALTLCSLMTVPGITEIVKHAILFAWAYGESIVDVRVLLKGKRVAAIKSADTWQLQLANLASLGTDEEEVDECDVAGGLTYQSYLRALLIMERTDNLSMRSLDLIESNLQIKTDQCVTKVIVDSSVTLRRGVKDHYATTFQYQ